MNQFPNYQIQGASLCRGKKCIIKCKGTTQTRESIQCKGTIETRESNQYYRAQSVTWHRQMKIQKSIIQSQFAFYTRHRTVYEDVIERIFKAMFQFFPNKSRSYIYINGHLVHINSPTFGLVTILHIQFLILTKTPYQNLVVLRELNDHWYRKCKKKVFIFIANIEQCY